MTPICNLVGRKEIVSNSGEDLRVIYVVKATRRPHVIIAIISTHMLQEALGRLCTAVRNSRKMVELNIWCCRRNCSGRE